MQKYLYKDLYLLEDKHWWHINKRGLVKFYIKQFLSGNHKILDVGCGTGKNIETFSEYGICFGIDSSPEAISFCKKRGIKNVIRGNVEKMPYPNKSFNIVTALDVLEHVDDSKSLREIHRIIQDKGIIIVTVPAFPQLWSKWDEVLHHKRRYTEKSLKNLLQKNDFKVLKISYMYSFLILPVFFIRFIKKFFYKNHYPSDFKLSNKIVNRLLGSISALERFLIPHTNLPFGTSLIAIAIKN